MIGVTNCETNLLFLFAGLTVGIGAEENVLQLGLLLIDLFNSAAFLAAL
jgi:hypothetical protein